MSLSRTAPKNLSERRAAGVVAYLQARGVDAARMISGGSVRIPSKMAQRRQEHSAITTMK
jgi:hypothetical protein